MMTQRREEVGPGGARRGRGMPGVGHDCVRADMNRVRILSEIRHPRTSDRRFLLENEGGVSYGHGADIYQVSVMQVFTSEKGGGWGVVGVSGGIHPMGKTRSGDRCGARVFANQRSAIAKSSWRESAVSHSPQRESSISDSPQRESAISHSPQRGSPSPNPSLKGGGSERGSIVDQSLFSSASSAWSAGLPFLRSASSWNSLPAARTSGPR